jgi:two-component system, sensor histidine kinase and response regulator
VFYKSKILIVEDNPLNKKIISFWLSKYGYFFCFAESGEAAIEIYTREWQEVIVMDISLPGINGFETVRRIREICREKNKRQPFVIALTAHTLDYDRNKCLLAGMDEYLSKPIDFELLNEMLSKAGEQHE